MLLSSLRVVGLGPFDDLVLRLSDAQGAGRIVTTSAPSVAATCDAAEVVALRRLPGSHRIEMYEGPQATLR